MVVEVGISTLEAKAMGIDETTEIEIEQHEFYHIDPGIVVANEQYFEIFSELRMNTKKLEAVVLDSFSIKSIYGKTSDEAAVVFCSILEAIRELPDSVENYLVRIEFLTDNFHVALKPTIFSNEPPVYSSIPRYYVQLLVHFGINGIGTGHLEMALMITGTSKV